MASQFIKFIILRTLITINARVFLSHAVLDFSSECEREEITQFLSDHEVPCNSPRQHQGYIFSGFDVYLTRFFFILRTPTTAQKLRNLIMNGSLTNSNRVRWMFMLCNKCGRRRHIMYKHSPPPSCNKQEDQSSVTFASQKEFLRSENAIDRERIFDTLSFRRKMIFFSHSNFTCHFENYSHSSSSPSSRIHLINHRRKHPYRYEKMYG